MRIYIEVDFDINRKLRKLKRLEGKTIKVSKRRDLTISDIITFEVDNDNINTEIIMFAKVLDKGNSSVYNIDINGVSEFKYIISELENNIDFSINIDKNIIRRFNNDDDISIIIYINRND